MNYSLEFNDCFVHVQNKLSHEHLSSFNTLIVLLILEYRTIVDIGPYLHLQLKKE